MDQPYYVDDTGRAIRLCPICAADLSRRRIPLREWLLHPIDSWRQHRFDKGYPASHLLLNHGPSETLHELSPSAYAQWSSND